MDSFAYQRNGEVLHGDATRGKSIEKLRNTMNCNGLAQRGLAMEWHRTATQGQGLAVEGDAMTGNGMASLCMAMAWQIIEGYAHLRNGSECKARAKPCIDPPSSGNELQSNEQKSKKEWIA